MQLDDEAREGFLPWRFDRHSDILPSMMTRSPRIMRPLFKSMTPDATGPSSPSGVACRDLIKVDAGTNPVRISKPR